MAKETTETRAGFLVHPYREEDIGAPRVTMLDKIHLVKPEVNMVTACGRLAEDYNTTQDPSMVTCTTCTNVWNVAVKKTEEKEKAHVT